MLREKIQENIVAAMKEKDVTTLQTLRFLMSAVKNKEIEKQTELADEDVVQIIKKQVKELNEAKEMFSKAGRQELAQANTDQITILSSYLPKEISDEELMQEIQRVINENKEQYEKNPRSLMGIAVNQLKSKADGQRIVKMLQNMEK